MPRRRPIIAAFALACATPLVLAAVAACGGSGGGSAASAASDAATATPSSVAVFDDHAHAAAFATALTSKNVSGLLLGGTAERAVLGSDWVVLVPDDAAYADAVHAALGGTLLDGGTSTAPASSGGRPAG